MLIICGHPTPLFAWVPAGVGLTSTHTLMVMPSQKLVDSRTDATPTPGFRSP